MMIFQRKLVSFCCCLFLLLATGCASIIKGQEQTFNIQSDPNQAQVIITDQKTNTVVWQQDTPFMITLKKGDGYFKGKTYHVKVSKSGYKDVEFDINKRVSGWYIGGNLVFGGLIGYLIVDPLTGAMWVLEPETTANVSVTDNTIFVRLLSDLSEEEKSRLRPITLE